MHLFTTPRPCFLSPRTTRFGYWGIAGPITPRHINGRPSIPRIIIVPYRASESSDCQSDSPDLVVDRRRLPA